mmetsp:Transcript_14553/g.26175  ORF Transcript_14553/g.26175 Transcript_14553/m.26175 type:complete len:83 (+) Transcript_14553:1244-1492(+)
MAALQVKVHLSWIEKQKNLQMFPKCLALMRQMMKAKLLTGKLAMNPAIEEGRTRVVTEEHKEGKTKRLRQRRRILQKRLRRR